MAKGSTKATEAKKSARQTRAKGLLASIKVADFGWVATGPLSGKYLSDCGAEVIKVEGRTRPDSHRPTRGPGGMIISYNRGRANYFATGKMSLCLNLARPRGIEIAKRVVAWADVVCENMGSDAMEKMGLGYAELKKVNPDIIQLGSSLQGRTGPAASSRGGGVPLSALSGFSHIAGWPDRKPAELGFYTDYIGPHYNVVAILAALLYRRRTGKGIFIDMSQYEAGIQFLAPLLLDYFVNGRVASRMGNRSTYAAPHNTYRCRGSDRWCTIAITTEAEWQSFVKVIGNPAWTKDPGFNTFLARKRNEDELDRLVEKWTQQHTAEEVMTMLQQAGVPAGTVVTGEDLVEHDPQLAHQPYFTLVDHPEAGPHLVHPSPFVPSKSSCEVRRSPLLGEHNEYVLKDLLKFSEEEIAELVIDGAVE